VHEQRKNLCSPKRDPNALFPQALVAQAQEDHAEEDHAEEARRSGCVRVDAREDQVAPRRKPEDVHEGGDEEGRFNVPQVSSQVKEVR
jgi:hypothetical protein